MTIVERPANRANWSTRAGASIDAIILHDTGARTAESTLKWFENPGAQVSSHYVIGRDGTIYRCVQDEAKAWHAGISALWSEDNLNRVSIGIELTNTGNEVYPEAQYQSLVDLTAQLVRRYRISLNRIVGHRHVCVPQGRKQDPNNHFPWFSYLIHVAKAV